MFFLCVLSSRFSPQDHSVDMHTDGLMLLGGDFAYFPHLTALKHHNPEE